MGGDTVWGVSMKLLVLAVMIIIVIITILSVLSDDNKKMMV